MKRVVITLSLIFWPLTFILNNKPLHLNFLPKTIFVEDYQAEQKVIRDTHLYKTVFMARLFHNKARIIIDKFNGNLFSLIDPNNYFFGFAPRQIVENQNLQKYPFVALPFAAWGVWNIRKLRYKNLLFISFVVFVLMLSMLDNFDKYDFVLWFPISALLINGVHLWPRKYKTYFWLFFIFAIPELVRLFI